MLDEVSALKRKLDLKNPKVVATNRIIVFHNLLEEIAAGFFSGFASRREIRSALDRWLVVFRYEYEGFYRWYIDTNRALDPPKEHGYGKIAKLVDRVAVADVAQPGQSGGGTSVSEVAGSGLGGEASGSSAGRS